MSEAALHRGGRALPPLTFVLPVSTRRPAPRRRTRAARVSGLAMYATALVLVVVNERFRGIEATIIRPLAGLVTGGHGSVAAGSIVYFALGTPHAFGLQVTDECTSALLLIPLLVMMGSFTTFSRIPLRRQLAALAVGAALIVGVNVLRVAGIAWATWRFGYDPGYTMSHVFVGSAFSLLGFVGAMLTALWILVRTERAPRRVRPSASRGSVRRPGPGRSLAAPRPRRPRAGPQDRRPRPAQRRHPRPGPRRPRPGTGMRRPKPGTGVHRPKPDRVRS